MNIYQSLSVIGFVFYHMIYWAGRFLSNRSFQSHLPEELCDSIHKREYAVTRQYVVARTRIQFISRTCILVSGLALVFGGGLNGSIWVLERWV